MENAYYIYGLIGLSGLAILNKWCNGSVNAHK